MGGLWTDLPRLSAFGTFFILAAMGLPGLGNFVGEFLILRGSWPSAPIVTSVAAIGLIPAALYSLIAVQRAFHGPADMARHAPDFEPRETAMMLALAAAIIWLGVNPQPVLNIAAPALTSMAAAENKMFFFEKKNQKTFVSLPSTDVSTSRVNVTKVFGAPFFKKARSFFLSVASTDCPRA
jgi:NADH:ubiquinone oxidoreductase subunit 4 (subunit M)